MAKDPQAPQFPEDQHGPKYDNDTPNNWLRGKGQEPGFDYGVHGDKGPKRSGPPNAENWGRKTADERYGRK